MTTGLWIRVEDCSPGLGTGGEGAEGKQEVCLLAGGRGFPPDVPCFLGVLDADDVGVRMGPATWRDKALPTLGDPIYNIAAPHQSDSHLHRTRRTASRPELWPVTDVDETLLFLNSLMVREGPNGICHGVIVSRSIGRGRAAARAAAPSVPTFCPPPQLSPNILEGQLGVRSRGWCLAVPQGPQEDVQPHLGVSASPPVLPEASRASGPPTRCLWQAASLGSAWAPRRGGAAGPHCWANSDSHRGWWAWWVGPTLGLPHETFLCSSIQV